MKVYVAASFPRREEARNVRDLLVRAGHEVTSKWLDQEVNGYEIKDLQERGQFLRKAAQSDVDDIGESDCFVMLIGDNESKGGRHTELGIALIFGKRIVLLLDETSVIDPLLARESVFQYMVEVEAAVGEDHLIELLGHDPLAL